MSLDVRLSETVPTEVYWANITHNLAAMAREAGIYAELWRPDELGLTKARDLIPVLTAGIAKMKADPDRFRKFDAENGWGTYEKFVPWVERYLDACKEHPDAEVSVCR